MYQNSIISDSYDFMTGKIYHNVKTRVGHKSIQLTLYTISFWNYLGDKQVLLKSWHSLDELKQ